MTRPDVLPSAICTASAPRIGIFRGSMAGLCAPLSTLRRNPRGPLRMTRGRCGSLLLHRKRLALSTPCRSPGASQMFSALPLEADMRRTGWDVRVANNGLMHRSKQHRHSITSSARSSSDFGTSTPSALAVLRFTTSSNLVGCSTGRSPGFAPLKILSTKTADRRNRSRKSTP